MKGFALPPAHNPSHKLSSHNEQNIIYASKSIKKKLQLTTTNAHTLPTSKTSPSPIPPPTPPSDTPVRFEHVCRKVREWRDFSIRFKL